MGRTLGLSDCERIGEGLLAQPVGAATSLAFVGAAVWLGWRWRDLPTEQRRPALVYAGLLALVGAGSVAYHGPQGPGASLLHDVPIVLLLIVGMAVPVSRAVRRVPVFRALSRRRVAALAGLATGALLAYGTGRTGSPACDPDSLLQVHGAWHAASAVLLAAWGAMLWPVPSAGAVHAEHPSRTLA